jgi:Uma2 family endonuclease
MASLAKPRFTPQEYLAMERAADYKSEYVSGEIFAMARTSYKQAIIVANLLGEFRQQLRGGPCRAVANDLRVSVPATGAYTYPDVVIVCGQPQFGDEHLDTLLNPTVLMEVLSDSTEAFDRGGKFAHCRRLASLQEYVSITQSLMRIEHFVRDGERWVLTELNALGDTLELVSVNASVRLPDIYEDIDLTPPLSIQPV